MKFKKLGYALEWCWLSSSVQYVGYRHEYYDGDFWQFGFWFFHIYLTNNPHAYLSSEEISANVKAWLAKSEGKNDPT